jgi:hypothetical protein
MSNLAHATRPAPATAPRPRHIEIVTTRQQRRARPAVSYAIVTVVSLAVIFAAQLLLSIVVSDGAYEIAALQAQQKELLREQQALTEELDVLGSTQYLAANAANLGMVPGASPLFIDVSTGGVAPAPGTVDRVGCGGACNLVGNSMLTGRPLVSPTPPASTAAGTASTTTTATDTTTHTTPTAPTGPVDELPAPVTH